MSGSRHGGFSLSGVAILVLVVSLALAGCGKDGAQGPASQDGMSGPTGSTGATGPSGVEIYSITASPSVLKPGADATLSVSAGDGVNSALTYSWHAENGVLNTAATSSVVWTAPASVGSYMVSVDVTNAAGLTSTGYASILVSVSPAGPIITSVNPTEVKAGDQIRITGAGFGSAQGSSSVSIGGVQASSVISWSDTVIDAVTPVGATTGSVIVTEAGVDSSPGDIVVLWTKENPENVAIVTAAGNQLNLSLISDGSGGALITWTDARNGNVDIYAQRVNSSGTVQWTADGVAISTAANSQYIPALTSDGLGGAIIAWQDDRSGNYDIYAQRVNSAGVVQWTADGVAISTAANFQYAVRLISDGSGGAIIAWVDRRTSPCGIYAQRVNSSGVVQWTADGVAITNVAGDQPPDMVADGTGGAIMTWYDNRSGNNDIYAQRVNYSGAVLWTADGVAVSAAVNMQVYPRLIPDGSGGAIIVWEDDRNATRDIYAQRVNSSGAVQWTADGVPVCAAAGSQSFSQLIPDGSGGAIISWSDDRSGGSDVYAQRVNSSGTMQWTANGLAISSAAGDQVTSYLISDGSGGAILTWHDMRSGNYDIYAQRVNSSGAVRWTVDGVAISTAAADQFSPQIISDGSGGAIISWTDKRSGNDDNYAQGVSASGRL